MSPIHVFVTTSFVLSGSPVHGRLWPFRSQNEMSVVSTVVKHCGAYSWKCCVFLPSETCLQGAGFLAWVQAILLRLLLKLPRHESEFRATKLGGWICSLCYSQLHRSLVFFHAACLCLCMWLVKFDSRHTGCDFQGSLYGVV